MLINIYSDINEKAYDCYQKSIMILAEYYKCNYKMIALGGWGFRHEPISSFLGQNIRYYRRENIDSVIDKYCEYFLDYLAADENNLGELKIFIIDYLKNNIPVKIRSDLFWCPWNMAYQKYHFTHFFLIIGYVEKTDVFICYDPYINNKIIEVPFDDIKSGIKGISTFNIKESAFSLSDLYDDVLDDINCYIDKNSSLSLHNIFTFANDLKQHLDIANELTNYNKDLFAVPLLDNIRIICINRYSYVHLLNYVYEKTMDAKFKNAASALYACANEWEKVRSKLIKYTMIPHSDTMKAEIADVITRIGEREYITAESILKN